MKSLSKQNQVNLSKIELVSFTGKVVDLSNIMVGIDIFEDIFSNGMSGTAILVDSYSLIETLPIHLCGKEILRVEFTTENSLKRRSKEFTVTGISDIVYDDNRALTSYSLHFTSVPFAMNLTKRLNMSFGSEVKQIYSSDVVQTVCDKMLGIKPSYMTIEKSKFPRNFVATNWTPFQMINHLAESDVSNATETSFLFYEDFEGFKFVSLNSIMDGRVSKSGINSLFFGIQNDASKTAVAQVIKYNIVDLPDILKDTRNGVHQNKFVYHDMLNKTTQEKIYVESSDKSSTIDTPYIPSNNSTPKDAVFLLPAEGEFAFDFATKTPWRQERHAKINRMKQYSVVAQVSGNMKLRVGSRIHCDIPSTRKKADGNKDTIHALSGNYLITQIRHSMNKNKYIQTVRLSREYQRKI